MSHQSSSSLLVCQKQANAFEGIVNKLGIY